jgi:hypothetical protein
MIVGQLALYRFKANSLQHHIAVWIGENFLVNAIASAVARVRQFVSRNSRLEETILKGAVPFLFRKKITAVCDNESHVARAGLIHSRKVNFIQNAVA